MRGVEDFKFQVSNVKFYDMKMEIVKNNRSVAVRFAALLAAALFMAVVLMPCGSCRLYADVAGGGRGIDKAERLLVLNSNSLVRKYALLRNEFAVRSGSRVIDVDLGSKWVDEGWVEDIAGKDKVDLLLCIGSKAYVKAAAVTKKLPIIFTMGINWRRMALTDDTFVIESELPAEAQLMIYRMLFPEIDRIGIIYSKSNNKQWVKEAASVADKIGIELVAKAVRGRDGLTKALQSVLPLVDALWIIPDPVVLAGRDAIDDIFTWSDKYKRPVFAYERLFVPLGASLIISADIPTIAGQAVHTAEDILAGRDVRKVQKPAGSHIAINLKKIETFGVKVNNGALSSVNEFIE